MNVIWMTMEAVERQGFETETACIVTCPSLDPKRDEDVCAVDLFVSRLQQNGWIDTMDRNEEKWEDGIVRFMAGEEKKIAVFGVGIQQKGMFGAMQAGARKIKRLQEETGDVHVFLGDGEWTHGFAMAAMLKLEGIEPEGLEDAKDVAQALEDMGLACAMRDFDRHGDVEPLAEYFTKKLGKEADDDKAIQGMKNIANGLSYCSLDLFAEGLETLRELYDGKSSDSILQDAAGAMVRERLARDFGGLLASPNRCRAMDIVEWCVRKKKLPQALAFLDAGYLNDLFQAGVLYFNLDEETIVDKPAIGKKEKAVDYLGRMADAKRLHDDDCVGFVLQEYTYYKFRNPFQDNVAKDAKKKVAWMHAHLDELKEFVHLVENHGDYPYILSLARKIAKDADPGLMLSEKGCYSWDSCRFRASKDEAVQGVRVRTDLPTEDSGKGYRLLAGIVLDLYYVFKDAKNRLGHGKAVELPDGKELLELAEVFCKASGVLLSYADLHGAGHGLENINTRFSLARAAAKKERMNEKAASAVNASSNRGSGKGSGFHGNAYSNRKGFNRPSGKRNGK